MLTRGSSETHYHPNESFPLLLSLGNRGHAFPWSREARRIISSLTFLNIGAKSDLHMKTHDVIDVFRHWHNHLQKCYFHICSSPVVLPFPQLNV